MTIFSKRTGGLSVIGLLTGPSVVQAAGPFDYTAFLKGVQVPADFSIGLAAGSPAIRFPMFAYFDDAGRLYVAESSGKDFYAGLRDLAKDCRVSRLEDEDGDGRFEKGRFLRRE